MRGVHQGEGMRSAGSARGPRGCDVAQRSRKCTCLASRSFAGADMDSGAEYLSGTVAVQCQYSVQWQYSSTVIGGHRRCCRQIPALRASPTHSIGGKFVHPSSTQMHTAFCYRSRAGAPAPHLPSGTSCSSPALNNTAICYRSRARAPAPHLPSGTSCSSPALNDLVAQLLLVPGGAVEGQETGHRCKEDHAQRPHILLRVGGRGDYEAWWGIWRGGSQPPLQ